MAGIRLLALFLIDIAQFGLGDGNLVVRDLERTPDQLAFKAQAGIANG
jgi:hypothetical protein